MRTYSTEEFINSVIRNSFKEQQTLDRTQLNRIAYLTAQEIFNITGNKVIAESFDIGSEGPFLPSVYTYFLQFRAGRGIKEYMKLNSERTRFVDDVEIEKIIAKVWNKSRCMPLFIMLASVPTLKNQVRGVLEKETLMAS